MAYDDVELLRLVADEKDRAIGFDNASELIEQRELSLNYIKGVMPDVPSLPNRSRAVSTDVADTVETWLADIVEIFTAGEDVASFRPQGEEDEAAAKQETDYVNHVFFDENDGFMILYSMFKDAGQVKTGVVKWWTDEVKAPEPKRYTGQPESALAIILQDGAEPLNLRPSEQAVSDVGAEQPIGPLWDFEIAQKPRKRVKVASVPPEDFAVAADTVRLKDTTYCAMKARPRAQDLIARGVSPDIVDKLPAYGAPSEVQDLARDTVGEHDRGVSSGGIGDLRQVETIEHYIRLVEDDGEFCIWRVETGADCTTLIEKEKVDEITFAAITPYPVPHRFYGESVADKVMEPQKIKTALTRIALDSAYFALNQRNQVSEEQSSDNTLPDLFRNEPGMPIRSKTGTAVSPLQAGSLNFDPFGSLEYFSTVIEQRTGIVRNAQGLNPDTLHDTAKGAGMLMTASVKRTRLMARIFAETGMKDLWLGMHAMLRRIGGVQDTVRLRGKWVPVDPTQWGERNDMTIELGVGSSGREQDLAAMSLIASKQAEAVLAQGGSLNGPLVTGKNLYNTAIRLTEKTGIKDPEAFWTDPDEHSQQNPTQPPPPDPAAMAAAASAQNDAQKLQLDQTKAQAGAQKDMASLQLEDRRLQLDEARLQLDAENEAHNRQMAEQQFMLSAQQAQAKLDTESALALAEINAKYSTQITVAQIKSEAEQFRAHADLAIQASEHQHSHEAATRDHVHSVIETAMAQPSLEAETPAETAAEPGEEPQ